jgi:hypothetical protein
VKTAITALVVGRAGKPKGAGRVQPLFDAALSHRKSKSSQWGSVASTGLRRSPTSDPGTSAYRAHNRDRGGDNCGDDGGDDGGDNCGDDGGDDGDVGDDGDDYRERASRLGWYGDPPRRRSAKARRHWEWDQAIRQMTARSEVPFRSEAPRWLEQYSATSGRK